MQHTEAYVLGVREGREFLRFCPPLSIEEIKQIIDNLNKLIPSFSGDMKDMFKGERDFWKNQLKKKG